jgi:predicted dehydrogenase
MINAAIVGLGRWGKNLVDSVQGKSDHLQFTHGVVRTPSTSRDYAARHAIELSTEFDRVLDDKRIEAVVLTTPHTLHTEQIIAAAQAGKAVFCEKPLALRKGRRRACDRSLSCRRRCTRAWTQQALLAVDAGVEAPRRGS